MKLLLLQDLNDPTKLKTEYRSDWPEGTICEAPHSDAEILDVIDVIDAVTQKVTGKRAVVNETKRTAKIAKEKADEIKRGQEQSKSQAELKLTADKLEALWDAVALNDLTKLNALKMKLK